jgi:hypothetical protein
MLCVIDLDAFRRNPLLPAFSCLVNSVNNRIIEICKPTVSGLLLVGLQLERSQAFWFFKEKQTVQLQTI